MAEDKEFKQEYLDPVIDAGNEYAKSIGGNVYVAQGDLQSPNYAPVASAGWQITNDGDATFNNLTAKGKITVSAGGVIGGFDIGTDYLRDSGNTFGFSSAITAGDDIRLWAGATLANFATAPFRLTEAGVITASSGTIGGWTLGTTSLTATGITLSSTGDAYIAIGTTPPTSPTAGTGIFMNKTGLFGLNANTQNFKLDNTGITASAGIIAGFTISGTNLYVGYGATRITLDTSEGISLGASTFATSPFSVTPAGVLKAQAGFIGGTTITSTTLYGGIIQTSATVGVGNNGVIMDSAGLRGYDSVLGNTFNLYTDGTAPTFSSGVINETIFKISTNAVLRTSSTVGDGSASSAGILINNTGLYGCEASQTLANANVKILVDGSAVIKANIKGGQTDYNTGTGYFLGLSGGDYKFSIGNPSTNYMTWDGTFLKLKGSFDVGSTGLINNASYTVANLPIAPTSIGFYVPSATNANYSPAVIDTYNESNQNNFAAVYSGQTKVAQSFSVNNSTILDSAKFYLLKIGSPTGNAVATLYAHTGNYGASDSSPTGSALATSDTFDVSTLSTSYALITFNFSGGNRITLEASTHYYIVIEYSGGSGLNYVKVGLDTSSPTHGGRYALWTGSSWYRTADIDIVFYVYKLQGNFTDPANIYASDDTYATLAATSGDLTVEVSKDAGANWQTPKTVTFTGSDTLQTAGTGSTELWGSSFTRADMVDANFRVRLSQGNISQIYKTFGFATGSEILTGIEIAIEGKYASSTLSLDLLEVKIHYGTSNLPVQAGSQVYASNGRKVGEGAGSGTGTMAYYDGTAWRRVGDDTTVAS